MTEKHRKPHRISTTALRVAVALGTLFVLSLIPYWLDLRYVADLPVILLYLLLASSLVAIFISAYRRAGRRHFLRGLCAVLIAGIALIGGGVALIYMTFGVTLADTRVEASPSGKHRVLIVENGLIDAAYRAYPMVNALLYRNVTGGCISCRNFRGSVDASTIVWVSDSEAHIRVPDAEGFSSIGNTEEIVVRFE